MTKKLKSKITKKTSAGFTLVEMLVAVFVFSIVMVIATGAIFSIVSANKTSQALKSVLDNLNSAIDDMSSAIRYGSNYHCIIGAVANDSYLTTPASCQNSGSVAVAFISNIGEQIVYQFDAQDQKIEKCTFDSSNNLNCFDLTAPEVHVTDMHFYILGADSGATAPNDSYVQPQMLLTLTGYAVSGLNQSKFNLETMVTQRNPVCKKDMAAAHACINN